MTQVLIETKFKHNGLKQTIQMAKRKYKHNVKAIVPWTHVYKRMQVFKCSTYRRPQLHKSQNDAL